MNGIPKLKVEIFSWKTTSHKDHFEVCLPHSWLLSGLIVVGLPWKLLYSNYKMTLTSLYLLRQVAGNYILLFWNVLVFLKYSFHYIRLWPPRMNLPKTGRARPGVWDHWMSVITQFPPHINLVDWDANGQIGVHHFKPRYLFS